MTREVAFRPRWPGKAFAVIAVYVALGCAVAQSATSGVDYRRGVVIIEAVFQGTDSQGGGQDSVIRGAGMILDAAPNGWLIMTAKHNVFGASNRQPNSIRVVTYGSDRVYPASIFRVDSGLDLAALVVEGLIPLGTRVLQLAADVALPQDAPLTVIGHFDRLPWQVDQLASLIVLDVASQLLEFRSSVVREGFSGGPVIDESGRVVGMTVEAHSAGGASRALIASHVLGFTERVGIGGAADLFTVVDINLPNGTARAINVRPVLGSIARLLEINREPEGGSIDVWERWDWPILLPNPLPTHWHAYQLPHGGGQPCPDWPNRYDTASMRYAIHDGVVLVFAEKAGDYPARLLLPISGSNAIEVLGELFRRSSVPVYQGPLNASIQLFLADETARGEITVYSGHGFTDHSCTIVVGEPLAD